jgi:hypothetical protein
LLWSEAPLSESIRAIGPLLKFLVLPFFLYYFELSRRSAWVLSSFFLSCTILMLYSWIVTVEPTWALKTGRCCGEDYGVPIKNYIDQSQEFCICLVALLATALYGLEQKAWRRATLLALVASLFAANLVFVVTSRTAMICAPAMMLFVAWRHAKTRGILLAMGIGSIIVVAAWFASPHLRARIMSVQSQFLEYRDADVPSSVGKRLEFWRKSIRFVSEAPIIGHGTGSIHRLFELDAIGQSGTSAEIVANPHNQTFNVAIQWGILGLIVLYALWFVHARRFFGGGLVAEIGLLFVVQNVVGSIFNSHLFDFLEGWLYVLGVGVSGGILAKLVDDESGARSRANPASASPPPIARPGTAAHVAGTAMP